ncbi:MAG: hypothetical protein HYU05_01580 [Candidatus Wildermuthbacteria bacterium]|nr:hypothetical protein [Candidatus Wildermuthbacteria bacterium]MBI2121369.1 hypothetical protein [Candidatus Wildermuthbacteria bacterium]MBI2647830.1 hypothetical protein [Candidatus Wildermuthbacteria bacterium]
MTLRDIQELVAEEGGKVIIVERDEVVAVVLSHEAYRALKAQGRHSASHPVQKPEAPRPPAPMKEEAAEDSPDFGGRDELTIDDLPL